jgi:excisionase family DNA binding protein
MPDKSTALEPEFVSVAEGGRLLSVGKTTMFGLIREGRIDTVKIGRKRAVRLSSIRNFGRQAT